METTRNWFARVGSCARLAGAGILLAIVAWPAAAQECSSNGSCPPDEYCAKAIGDCDGAGVCTPRPTGCPDVWDPVCGCDGNTYSNSCDAAAAGVSIAHVGTCRQGCASNDDCAPDEYCEYAVGDCDGPGVCMPRPIICPTNYDPVCGCDGVTYGNACAAAAAGVSIAHLGPCAQGCRTNGECANDEYCAKEVGDCNGPGVCTPRPTACPDVWDPVCGCDGNTYSNSCDAAAVGVSIAHLRLCCPGDLNGDGVVGFGDLTIVLLLWGPCQQDPCPADLTGDGVVGFADVTFLLLHWGPC